MALPESAPPSRPPLAGALRDLDEAEFDELGRLLAAIPEPLEPLALDEADGFVTGIAVQPAALPAEVWQRFVFDAGGHRWGEAEPSPERARAAALLARREAAVRRALAEHGGFDPWLVDAGDAADPISETIAPWLSGLLAAVDRFPLPDDGDGVGAAVLARFEALVGAPASDRPASGDVALAEVMDGVLALYDAAERRRYRVETVQRVAPKTGRNDPCPCGSGRKFKHCHGQA